MLAATRLLSSAAQREAMQMSTGQHSDPTVHLAMPSEPATAANANGLGPNIPRVLGPYRLLRRLGEGGMGMVFEAEDTKLERSVAIKLISPRVAGDGTAIQRLEAEARAAARLTHPNIVTVHALGTDAGWTYIAMEKVEGESVADLLKREVTLRPSHALDLAIQAAKGLGFAWKQQIIHRDIKPGNLLVTADGVCKVADFGLAKRLDNDLGLTATSVVVGSPHFMAPEQGAGDPVDFRADLYALGITLYTMVTGRPPFDGSSILSVMIKHTKEDLPIPPELRALCDGKLVPVLRRMTEKKPEKRYQSYEDLIADLEKLRAASARTSAGANDSTRKVLVAVLVSCVVLAAAAIVGIVVVATSDPKPMLPTAAENFAAATPQLGGKPEAPLLAGAASDDGSAASIGAPPGERPMERSATSDPSADLTLRPERREEPPTQMPDGPAMHPAPGGAGSAAMLARGLQMVLGDPRPIATAAAAGRFDEALKLVRAAMLARSSSDPGLNAARDLETGLEWCLSFQKSAGAPGGAAELRQRAIATLAQDPAPDNPHARAQGAMVLAALNAEPARVEALLNGSPPPDHRARMAILALQGIHQPAGTNPAQQGGRRPGPPRQRP